MQVKGFTLIELVCVIILLGIVAVSAAPRMMGMSRDAKVASMNNIVAQMESTNKLVQMKARIKGLKPDPVNPNAGQSALIIDFDGFSTEVMHNNLCPEARSELGDASDYFDFLHVSGDLDTRTDNRYALIGYDLPITGRATNEGCYAIYDSFDENCAVTLVTADC